MTDEVAEPYADYAGYELAAEPVRLHLDVVAGSDHLSVCWEALGAAPGSGMVAGSPAKSRVLWGRGCCAWRAWVKGW